MLQLVNLEKDLLALPGVPVKRTVREDVDVRRTKKDVLIHVNAILIFA